MEEEFGKGVGSERVDEFRFVKEFIDNFIKKSLLLFVLFEIRFIIYNWWVGWWKEKQWCRAERS